MKTSTSPRFPAKFVDRLEHQTLQIEIVLVLGGKRAVADFDRMVLPEDTTTGGGNAGLEMPADGPSRS